MKQFIFVALFSLMTLFHIGAVSLEDLLDRATITALHTEKKVVNSSTGTIQPQLVPKDDFYRTVVQDVIQKIKPTVMVENLYLYQKPASKIGKAWTESEQLHLFNEIRGISTLTGIEYYSASRKKMRIFYEYSSVIDSPESKNVLTDPVVQSIPKNATLFARQKDLTFGDNIYQYDYLTNEGSIIFIQTNLTTMSYGIIPLVQKGNLHSIICIIDTDNGLLLYAATFAKASTLPGLEGKIRDSFSNRTEAVYKWFETKADRIF